MPSHFYLEHRLKILKNFFENLHGNALALAITAYKFWEVFGGVVSVIWALDSLKTYPEEGTRDTQPIKLGGRGVTEDILFLIP